jgi:hypothetical protein
MVPFVIPMILLPLIFIEKYESFAFNTIYLTIYDFFPLQII